MESELLSLVSDIIYKSEPSEWVFYSAASLINTSDLIMFLFHNEEFGHLLNQLLLSDNHNLLLSLITFLRQIYSYSDIVIPGFDITLLLNTIQCENGELVLTTIDTLSNMMTDTYFSSLIVSKGMFIFLVDAFEVGSLIIKESIIECAYNTIQTLPTELFPLLIDDQIIIILTKSLEIDDPQIITKGLSGLITILSIPEVYNSFIDILDDIDFSFIHHYDNVYIQTLYNELISQFSDLVSMLNIP